MKRHEAYLFILLFSFVSIPKMDLLLTTMWEGLLSKDLCCGREKGSSRYRPMPNLTSSSCDLLCGRVYAVTPLGATPFLILLSLSNSE